jgi:DNA-binding Lrp family transcriptional regulator
MLTPLELTLIDRWQHDFPLVERPFEIVGRFAALKQAETIRIFQSMRDREVISRIGAVVRPNTVGASTLAAIEVPQNRLDEVADLVSQEPLVTHNYEREHLLNLWFVIAGADTNAVAATIRRIEKRTGFDVIELPLLRAYHLGLGFPLQAAVPQQRATTGRVTEYFPGAWDCKILAAIEDGLPLVERPYQVVADELQLGEADVIARLEHLVAAGVVTRFGCVVRHEKLGYRANAMVVWDIPDAMVDNVAGTFARHPSVTLCYRRPRHLPVWPYNLFCMVHSRSRSDAFTVIDEINLQADTGLKRQAVLFSRRCFKQRGAVFSVSAGVN